MCSPTESSQLMGALRPSSWLALCEEINVPPKLGTSLLGARQAWRAHCRVGG